MEIIKFQQEVSTLKKFFEVYCKNKHEEQKTMQKNLNYKDIEVNIELTLCSECLTKIEYSFDRLKECQHEIKPRCRTCPTPCYEKKQWKDTAKIMRYSGMKLGLLAINKRIKNLFKKSSS